MPKLQLSLACWDYDRTRALADGSVRPEGIDLIYHDLSVEETFFRMLRTREFDAAEMSLSSYCVSLMRDEPAFIAIPVFPSRFFRHSCIFVSAKSGICEPKELAGKRIGVPEYQMTAPVWVRGILQDEYGVDPAGCEYWTGGEEEPGRDEKLAPDLPAKFRLKPIGPKKRPAGSWAKTGGPTASSPTDMCWKRSCAITTSRDSPSAGSKRRNCSPRRRSSHSACDSHPRHGAKCCLVPRAPWHISCCYSTR